MVTFAEAREIVRGQLESHWTPGSGTLYVAQDGFEDADYWLVRAGAREALVDGDPRFDIYDCCELVVGKESGRFGLLHLPLYGDRLARMTPVSG